MVPNDPYIREVQVCPSGEVRIAPAISLFEFTPVPTATHKESEQATALSWGMLGSPKRDWLAQFIPSEEVNMSNVSTATQSDCDFDQATPTP